VIDQHVERGSNLYSDAHRSYIGLDRDYMHKVIDHAESYVDGEVHTNGLENFWSLLKRAIKGTYVSIEPFHLFRYLDEQAFRFNHRNTNDHGHFVLALRGIMGKRLTYTALTGSELPESWFGDEYTRRAVEHPGGKLMTKSTALAFVAAGVLGWQAHSATAETASAAVQWSQRPVLQQLRIEPIDAGRVRLRIEGGEPVVVSAAGFTLVTEDDGFRVVTAPGNGESMLGTGKTIPLSSFTLRVGQKGVITDLSMRPPTP